LTGENVNLFVAVAGHQQTRLDGRYEVDQILKEDLSEDKLEEKTFGTSLIYGITFRFDNNPFKKKEAPKTSS
jgi:hypothetical protein